MKTQLFILAALLVAMFMMQSCDEDEDHVHQPNVAAKAYLDSISQSIPPLVQTKVMLDGVDFDTYGNFQNSRFTATVEGYYDVNAAIYFVSAEAGAFYQISLYKNGARHSSNSLQAVNSNDIAPDISDVIHLNGVDDYIELFAQNKGSDPISLTNSSAETFMSVYRINW